MIWYKPNEREKTAELHTHVIDVEIPNYDIHSNKIVARENKFRTYAAELIRSLKDYGYFETKSHLCIHFGDRYDFSYDQLNLILQNLVNGKKFLCCHPEALRLRTVIESDPLLRQAYSTLFQYHSMNSISGAISLAFVANNEFNQFQIIAYPTKQTKLLNSFLQDKQLFSII